ncbi:Cys-tRNA(Pro) deacylase [Mycetocola saprophilus]|uniref:Cys-tRNA(Pro) deacylase n=1 Tax=Mycetocola saprophilus TaxID=76636 RepID=UPI003BF1920D
MAKKTPAPAGTPALRALAEAQIEVIAHEYEHDPAEKNFGLEAASKLDLDPARVFKTLVASVDGTLTVAVVPVSGMLDLKALAQAVGGKKAELADTGLAERKTGYIVGGISPVGQKTPLPTVIDEEAQLYDTVFVSGGRRGLDIELAPADLARITGATFAPIAKAR